MKEKIKILVISGPTGIGKTRLATRLASRLNGEILSCDSVQVYNELVIGANKERNLAVPQHLIDLVSFKVPYSVNDYYDQCIRMIHEVHGRGNVPMIVGGTGFYLTWLLYGRPEAPAPPASLIESIQMELKAKSWSECYMMLQEIDPIYAASLASNDYYRLIRALAIYRHTGKPLSSYRCPEKGKSSEENKGSFVACPSSVPTIEPDIRHDTSGLESLFDFRCFYLTSDRLSLARLIDKRCEEMLQAGLLSEVIELKRQGLNTDSSAGRSIGYYQTLQLIENLQAFYAAHLKEWSELERADTLLKNYILDFQTASRQYARRQDAWFHAEKSFFWSHWHLFDSDPASLSEYISQIFLTTGHDWEAMKREKDSRLNSVHQASLNLRFDAHYEKQMRTYSATLFFYSTSEARRPLLNELLAYYQSQ